jgi:hypothetical protein
VSQREKLIEDIGIMLTTTHEYRGYIIFVEYEPQNPVYSVDIPD